MAATLADLWIDTPAPTLFLGGWLLTELVFWICFHCILVPHANKRRTPCPYRAPFTDISERHLYLRKITDRVFGDLAPDTSPEVMQQTLTQYISSWFELVPVPVAEPSNEAEDETPVPSAATTTPKKDTFASIPSRTRSSISATSSLSDAIDALPEVSPNSALGTNVLDYDGDMVHNSSYTSSDIGSEYSEELPHDWKESNNSKKSPTSIIAQHTTEASITKPCYAHDDDDESISSSSSAKPSESGLPRWTMPNLYKQDADDFLCWALFAKTWADMTPPELTELDRCYQETYDRVGVYFEPFAGQTSMKFKPRLLSLEPMGALHRPFLVYVLVWLGKCFGAAVLLGLGFRRVQSGPVTGWFRPGQDPRLLPLLFFHGIAPSGLTLYIPMVVWGLLGRNSHDRSCLLIDNDSISCTLNFTAVTEQETVNGVTDLLDTLVGPRAPVMAAGHSFGSCPLSWLLLDAQFRSRLRVYALLDPVTIALSNPAVMTNFVYGRAVNKIRIFASSELFTEYYLRRHFSWYNSEVWLNELLLPNEFSDTVTPTILAEDDHSEDNSSKTRAQQTPLQVVVALSGKDEIVDSPAVKYHLDTFQAQHQIKHLNTVYWEGSVHAMCVADVRKWHGIRLALLEAEIASLRHSSAAP